MKALLIIAAVVVFMLAIPMSFLNETSFDWGELVYRLAAGFGLLFLSEHY